MGRPLSRTAIGRPTLLPLVFLALGLASACDRQPVAPVDLVLLDGRVVTMAPTEEEATAIAIEGPWIAAVGSRHEIEPLIGPETRVIELADRLVIPGFIEGHGHFLDLGRSLTVLDLTTAPDWNAIVAQVEGAVAASAPGEWIVGRGWHQEKWIRPPDPSVEGSPVHLSLSAVSPENPVLLEHASGHATFANRRAMELAGIEDDSPAPAGGELVRDLQGHLTGLLREAAQRPAWAAMEVEREGQSTAERLAEFEHWVDLAGQEALSHGVTTFHDAGASFAEIDLYQSLADRGALPVRLYVMVRGESNAELDRRLPSYRRVATGNSFLAVRSIKRQIDGALGSHGAWMLEPYSDMPESNGLVLESEEEILESARIAAHHGFQVNTHAIGDRANRRVLDLYEEVFRQAGEGADWRWRIEHAQHLDSADVPRFAALGVIASMQGIHCTSDGPWVTKRLGRERARTGAYLWRQLWDSGAIVTNGTDVPVEKIDPIANFYASVTRRMPNGEVFFPEQRLTRYEALQSYTANNAYAAFEERLKGTIEVGKLADLAVLSGDILRLPEDQITTARVDYTILGGEVRYEREE